MISPRRTQALIIKECYQMVRDPSCILIAFIFPLLLLFIYGYGLSLDLDHIKIGLVVKDHNLLATSFASTLRGSKYFDVEESQDLAYLERKVVDGRLKGVCIIPEYFSEFKNMTAEKGPIFIAADGSEPNTANFVLNYVQTAYENWLRDQQIELKEPLTSLVNLQPRYWYNEELNSHHFLIPGSIAIIMTLIGTLLTALVVAREWERGTIEALMTTPMTMSEFLISKLIAYFFLGMASMVFCTAISLYLFNLPFRGSIPALVGVSSAFLLAALATGLLISTIANSQFVAAQISTVTAFLPAFMLSGFIFDIDSMPFLIRLITNLFPAKYMVSSLQTLFLVGNVWQLLLFNISIMLIMSCVLFIAITLRTKKRLD